MQAAMTNIMPDSALAGMMEKQMKTSEEHKKDGADHRASREERDMIQAASNNFEGRDFQNDDRNNFKENNR